MRHLAISIICWAFCSRLHVHRSCPDSLSFSFLQASSSNPYFARRADSVSRDCLQQWAWGPCRREEWDDTHTHWLSAASCWWPRWEGLYWLPFPWLSSLHGDVNHWPSFPVTYLRIWPLGHSGPLISLLTLFFLTHFLSLFPLGTFLQYIHYLLSSTFYILKKKVTIPTAGLSLDQPIQTTKVG